MVRADVAAKWHEDHKARKESTRSMNALVLCPECKNEKKPCDFCESAGYVSHFRVATWELNQANKKAGRP